MKDIAGHFARELAELLALTPDPPPVRPRSRICVTSGNLDIAVTIADATIAVDLAGWQHLFKIFTEDDEDGEDAAALALDLIGAALFGGLRILVERFAGSVRRFHLQLHDGARWYTAQTQGSRPWSSVVLLNKGTRSLHVGATPRPERYGPVRVAAMPWAPWAGLAGFFGATANAGEAAELPVDGTLDLHNFSPREIKPLVLAYLDACLARGIFEVRIVHGKGIGNLRRTVHAILERHPRVKGFRLGGHGGGSWGATLVDLSREPGC